MPVINPAPGLVPSALTYRSLHVGMSQSSFMAKLETHIDSVKTGRPDFNSVVPGELMSRNSEVSSYLSRTDPKTLAFYSGIVSGMRYDRAARMVSSVQYQASTMTEALSEGKASKLADQITKIYSASSKQREVADSEKSPAPDTAVPHITTLQDQILTAGKLIQQGLPVPEELQAALQGAKFGAE